MASKKSGGAVATKKKPTASLKSVAKRTVKPAVAKKSPPKAVVPVRKPTKAPAKKALTITVVKKPVAPPAPAKPTTTRSLYSVHPSVSMMQRWIADLKPKTGRNLEEWIGMVRTSGPREEAARRIWLKDKHKLDPRTAWWIAERAELTAASLVDDDPVTYLKAAVQYVEEMYAGGKSALKPLHDRLLEIARVMGRDVRVCPCKTIVPIYRRHVIAQIFPASRTRIDFGLALRDTPASGRLIETGGWEKKDRITHRIPITSLAEIDSEVERWLRFAYELDA